MHPKLLFNCCALFCFPHAGKAKLKGKIVTFGMHLQQVLRWLPTIEKSHYKMTEPLQLKFNANFKSEKKNEIPIGCLRDVHDETQTSFH